MRTEEDKYFVSAIIGDSIRFNNGKIDEILLLYFAIKECEKRNLSSIQRIHDDYFDRFGRFGFDKHSLDREVKRLLSNISKEIDKGLEMIPTKITNPLRGQYIYESIIEVNPFYFYNFKLALVDPSKPIEFIRGKIDDDKQVFKWKCSTILLDNLLRSGMPLYYLTKIAIKEAICKKLGLETNGIKAGLNTILYPF